MSFLRSLLRSLYRPRHFIGTDLEGNRFFEYPSLSDGVSTHIHSERVAEFSTRSMRTCGITSGVQDASQAPCAVQWVSWLSHTRADPPTLEELRADIERQRRVLHNAAIIEAKDQEERARISTPSESSAVEIPHPSASQRDGTEEQGSPLHSSDVLKEPPPFPHAHTVEGAPQPLHSPGLPFIGKDRDWQPETWTPQAIRKRGG